MKYLTPFILVIFLSCTTNNTQSEKSVEERPVQSQTTIQLEDIEDKNLSELRIMRNEIFARHGYIFKSQDLREYFSSKDWYQPKFDNVNDKLTEIDSINIQLIAAQESQLKVSLPRTFGSNRELINELEKATLDSIPEYSKEVLFKVVILLKELSNRVADTTVYKVGQLDGKDGIDTIKTRVSWIGSTIQVYSSFSRGGNELWNYSYENPYLFVDGYEDYYDLIDENHAAFTFAIGVLYGSPIIQGKPSIFNFNNEDKRFLTYLDSFNGEYIAPGDPEHRDGLYVWDEFNKTFRLVYRP